jgi:hypothetical protein
MPFYRKRPVVIDANEWDGSLEKAGEIILWGAQFGVHITYHKGEWMYVGIHNTPNGPTTEEWVPEHLLIDTLEGMMSAQVGDFIIRGVQNEFYPCKPDIFWKTYEEL